MVKISELAAQKVKEIQKVKNKENAFLRIHLLNEGCSGPNFGMTLEESMTEDDMLYKEYGISIIADIRSQYNLSYPRDPPKPGLGRRPGLAKRHCGS